jgi:hypothetical protein
MMKGKHQASLDAKHSKKIEPADCFVTFTGNREGWKMIHGTGCAHYVAHKLGMRRGRPGINACDQGYVIKVPELVHGLARIEPGAVSVNDVWANHALTHCGIVTKVEPAADAKHWPKITITHCASNEHAHRLGPTVSDWASFFGGHGTFYKRPSS